MASPVVAALAAMLREAPDGGPWGYRESDKRDSDGRRPCRMGTAATGPGIINPGGGAGPRPVANAAERRLLLSFHPIVPGTGARHRTSGPIGGKGACTSRSTDLAGHEVVPPMRRRSHTTSPSGSRDVGPRAGDAGRHRGTTTTSAINFAAGQTIANGLDADLGDRRTSASSTGPTSRSNAVVDVVGYFSATPNPAGGLFLRRSHSGLRQSAGAGVVATLPVRSNYRRRPPNGGWADLVPRGGCGRLQHHGRRAGCERSPARNAGRCCFDRCLDDQLDVGNRQGRERFGGADRDPTAPIAVYNGATVPVRFPWWIVGCYQTSGAGYVRCRFMRVRLPRPTAHVRPGGAGRRTFRLAADRSVGRWDSIANTGVPRGRWPWRTT